MRKTIGTIVSVVLILGLIAVLDAESTNAEQKMSGEHGELTAIEQGGTVVISNKGYLTDSYTRVYDGLGRRTTLDAIEIPSAVYYEYVFVRKGALIRLLKVTPQ